MVSDPQTWHEGASGSGNLKYEIETENKQSTDYLR